MWRTQTEHTGWRVKSQEPPTEAGSGSERAEAERVADSLVFASLRELQLEAREQNNSGRIGSELPDPHIISDNHNMPVCEVVEPPTMHTCFIFIFLGGGGSVMELSVSVV